MAAIGKGDGPSAAVPAFRGRATSRPASYKIRSTESGTMPSDDDLIRSVRRGLYGTAMPGWDRILSDADINDVVQYVKSLSPQFARSRRSRSPSATALPSSPASIARGQQAYDKLQCGKCHGTDGRGTGAVATDVRRRLADAAARRGPHRAVDVPRRRDVARHLPAVPHRHDRHADAVVRRRRERRRDVGPRELRRVARRASRSGR